MNKKIIATALTVALTMGNMVAINATNVVGAEVECFESLASDVLLENKEITYIGGKYFSTSFEVRNKSIEEKTIIIKIKVIDDNGEKAAGTTFKRKVKPGKTIPIKFYAELKDILEPTVGIAVKEKVPTTFYVDADADAEGTGTEKNPMLLSLVPAKIAELDSKENYTGEDIKIVVMEDDYTINDTIKFQEFKNLSSVTVQGAAEGATLKGGINVKGKDFAKVTDEQILAMFPTDSKENIYSLNLAEYGVTLDFSDGRNVQNDPMYTVVYAGDKTQTMARYPNDSDLEDAYATWKPREKAKYPTEIYPWDGTTDTTGLFTFMSPNVADKEWNNYSEAWIRGHFIWDWDLAKGQIYSIEKKTADYYVSSDIHSEQEVMEINFDKYLRGSAPTENDLYSYYNKNWFVYNLPEEMDIPGEYVIYKKILYYYPENVANFDDTEIQINTDTNNMLEFTGDNYTVENLNFENSLGYFLKAQADCFTLKGCHFTKNAKNAAIVTGNNNLITQCDFYELGGQGISVGGGDINTLTPSGSVIENCYFKNCGQITRTNLPSLGLSGCGVTARRNTLTGAPHSAFAYGGNNHIVEYNDFYDCLVDGSTDAGILYVGANLSNLGTVVRNNYIHDSNSGLAAVYLDDWLSGQRVIGNVFENVENAFFIHGGVCNTFSGNIVINAENGARIRGKANTKNSNILKSDGKTYVPLNVWYMYLANSKGEYTDKAGNVLADQTDTSKYVKYNPHSNVFLSNLVGDAHSANPGQGYNGVDWQGDSWQNAYNNPASTENYRHVLSYVNNKPTNKAEETDFTNNCFVNVTKHFGKTDKYDYSNSLEDADKTGERSQMTSSDKTHYNDVKNNSGIYRDGYRTYVE